MLGAVVDRGSRRARVATSSRFAVSAVAVVIAATSCSSSGSVGAKQSPLPVTPSVSTSATTSASVQPSGGTGNTPSSGPASPGGTSAPTSTATTGGSAAPSASPSPLPLTAKLAHSCVQPGRTQTLHVHTLPKAVVVYDNFYSDGHDGATYGGRGTGGQADADGNYDATWTILPTAPTGKVRVEVAAAGGHTQTASRELSFDLKAIC